MICRVGDTEADLLREIHISAVHGGVGSKRLCAAFGARLLAVGHRAPEHRSFQRHVARHVERDLVPRPVGPGEEVQVVLPGGGRGAETELAEMFAMYQRIERRITEFDERPDAFVTESGKSNHQALAMWASCARTAQSILSDLVKLRRHDRTQTEMVATALNGFAGEIATGLGIELRAALRVVRRGEDVTDVLAALVEGEKLPGMFMHAAENAMGDIEERYRLGPRRSR